MTELLVSIGVFVFFISVYGAVMAGGHLLEELQEETERQSARDLAAAKASDPDKALSTSMAG